MRFMLPLLMLFIVLTQLACAPTQLPTTPLPPTQPTVFSTRVATQNPAQDLPDGAVIRYRRSGGIAGLDETFTIFTDGRITSAGGKEWHVSPQDVQGLLKEIEQAGMLQVEQSGPDIVPCCDRMSYTLLVSLDGKTYTAQTYDGAVDQPEAIQKAIDAMNSFLEANPPQ